MNIIFLTILILGTIADAIIDHKWIKRGDDPHTFPQYLARACAIMALASFQGLGFKGVWADCLVYWFVFDTALNIIRGLNLDYLSNRGIDALQKPRLVWFFLKAALAVGSIAYLLNPQILA